MSEPSDIGHLHQLVSELHASIHSIAIPTSKTVKNVPVPKTTFEQLVGLVDAIKMSLPPPSTLDISTLSEKLDIVLAALQDPKGPKATSPTYASVAAKCVIILMYHTRVLNEKQGVLQGT
jgi:hypothetical protein